MQKLLLVFAAALFAACNNGPFDISKEGGAVYTLECDVTGFLIAESQHTRNTGFLKALRATENSGAPRDKRFFDVFFKKHRELDPATRLVNVFAAARPAFYKANMTDEEFKDRLAERYDQSIDQTMKVISLRLDNFGVPQGDRNVYRNKQGLIVLEIADGYNQQRMRALMQVSGHLGFFETWENADTYPYLVKLNEELATDSILTATLNDSIKKQHPLFSHLRPALFQAGMDHQQLEQGCRIGTTLIRDTAYVNRILKHNITVSLLPHNMRLLWAADPESEENMEGFLSLYAIKAESLHYPALDGRVITDAHPGKDPYNETRTIVSLSMDQQGARDWEHLTDLNTGKAIAIVLDGYVYTAPRVESKIPNGQSVINGNFTMEEAEDLSHVLRSGSLPVRTRIINEKHITPER